MPTLTIRALGVSYLIEGIAESGLDPAELRKELGESYGPALAVIGGEGHDLDADPKGYQALILDRKADSWPALLDHLAGWVRGRGFSYAAWIEDPLSDGTRATLHFHA